MCECVSGGGVWLFGGGLGLSDNEFSEISSFSDLFIRGKSIYIELAKQHGHPRLEK